MCQKWSKPERRQNKTNRNARHHSTCGNGRSFSGEGEILRRKLRDTSPNSGPLAITNRILDPLVSRLGYAKLTPADNVLTREGDEDGGALMSADSGGSGGSKLRCWAIDYDADLDAPTQRGYAYRFSPVRIAQRVLLASGERVGLITNGVELRLLLCDPARPDSHLEIDLNVWRLSRDLPDGYLLLLALASPAGIAALPDIIEDARLKQNKVTKELRVQARLAVEEFIQSVLDHPLNVATLATHSDKPALAKALWHEGLVVVYRLLFILKCESTSDPSRVFRFASTPLWRNTYSPSTALARTVRLVLDEDATSGRYLEDGLRVLFKLFAEGLDHPGMTVRPLGGALFGLASTPMLSSLSWGELAVAHLLNRLLWSDTKRGRERVHYGPLDVEDLGRVYEALLELEPGIAVEPMCRLRRQKLEVVVPAAQGEKYRDKSEDATKPRSDEAEDEQADDTEEEGEDDKPAGGGQGGGRGKKTKVEWIEKIPPGRFYLRVGLGRKSTGSFYTPHSFVRFLVQETLGPQCDERSPRDNPDPGAILKLKVLDPACGSGHFLVEACRFLAGRLYEAARLCDELATKSEHDAEPEKNAARKQALLDRAAELRRRLRDLPDQKDELLSYLPSRSVGAETPALSAHDIARAEAICRRLVAVHCIYGADLNPLAVELAKLALWIESHAEGFPLTFLDHRIVVGNSLTGPFWEKLKLAPGSQQPVSDLFRQNLDLKLASKLGEALSLVKELEASVGVDVQDIAAKAQLKRELDERLLPFRTLAAAWSGGVMLGTGQPDGQPRCDDDLYADLLKHVGSTGQLPATIDNPNLRAMIDKGRLALPFDLTFPEVFHPTGQALGRHGFDAVIGNPPWDKPHDEPKLFFGAFDLSILEDEFQNQWENRADELLLRPDIKRLYEDYSTDVAEGREAVRRWINEAVTSTGTTSEGHSDLYMAFLSAAYSLVPPGGRIGMLLGGGLAKNPAARTMRHLVLRVNTPVSVWQFDNRKKLFEDLPGILEFSVVSGIKGAASDAVVFRAGVRCATVEEMVATNLPHVRSFPVPKNTKRSDQLTFAAFFQDAVLFEGGLGKSIWESLVGHGLHMIQEVNVTTEKDASVASDVMPNVSDPRLRLDELLANRMCPVLTGRSIGQYNSNPTEQRMRWSPVPQSVLRWQRPRSRTVAARLPYYRLSFRRKCGSPKSNERSLVACILIPGLAGADTILVEAQPIQRPNWRALYWLGVLNTYVTDGALRPRIQTTLGEAQLRDYPAPRGEARYTFIAHSAARLMCNCPRMAHLWRDQLGDAWREPGKAPFTWPVLAGDDERWAVRAAIDAVVADAYGLSREQYALVLSTFSHASHKKAPELCLAAFDELKAIGLEAFCRKHDPYWDIPLVETLPKPVIDLAIPPPTEESADTFNGNPGATTSRQKPSKRRPPQPTNAPSLFDPPPASATSPTDPGKLQAVKTLLELRKVLTSAEVQDQFAIDAAEARAILKQLVEDSLASVEGKAKGTRYRWSGG